MSKNISLRLNDNKERCLDAIMKLPWNEGLSINDVVGFLIICKCREECPEVYYELYPGMK